MFPFSHLAFLHHLSFFFPFTELSISKSVQAGSAFRNIFCWFSMSAFYHDTSFSVIFFLSFLSLHRVMCLGFSHPEKTKHCNFRVFTFFAWIMGIKTCFLFSLSRKIYGFGSLLSSYQSMQILKSTNLELCIFISILPQCFEYRLPIQ